MNLTGFHISLRIYVPFHNIGVVLLMLIMCFILTSGNFADIHRVYPRAPYISRIPFNSPEDTHITVGESLSLRVVPSSCDDFVKCPS